MPGYEKDRFVNLTKTEKCELICSICHEIFRNPVIANCCLQTFCEDCINKWLETEVSCPYDRKPLKAEELRAAPRVLLNLLGKLRIRCSYREKGCKEILHLENLSQHEDDCACNIKICKQCFCLISPGHNCVKELLALNKRDKEENECLKNERQGLNENIEKITEEFNEKIRLLKEENDKLKQQNTSVLKKTSTRFLHKAESNSALNISMPDMLAEARKHMSTPMIPECNTSSEVAERIVEIVKNELRNNNKMFYICQNIVFKCDQEFGSSWSCLANFTRNGQNFCHSSCYIKIKFGSLLFKIFRTKFLDLTVLRRRVRNGKIKPNLKIFESESFDKTCISYLQKVSFSALEKYNDLKNITTEIKVEMETKFGGHWHCVAYSYGDLSIHKTHKMFICYEIAELRLTVFQTD